MHPAQFAKLRLCHAGAQPCVADQRSYIDVLRAWFFAHAGILRGANKKIKFLPLTIR